MAGLLRNQVRKALRALYGRSSCNAHVRAEVSFRQDSITHTHAMLVEIVKATFVALGITGFRLIKSGQLNGENWILFSCPAFKAQEGLGGHAGAVSNIMFQDEQEMYEQDVQEVDAEGMVVAPLAPVQARRGRSARRAQGTPPTAS